MHIDIYNIIGIILFIFYYYEHIYEHLQRKYLRSPLRTSSSGISACEIVENVLLARRNGTEPKRHELKPNRTTRQHHPGNITQMSSPRCRRLEMAGYYNLSAYSYIYIYI